MTNLDDNKVIVRFPPSPTGKLHIGNIRALLFNYLYARKHNGDIVMRFEDTDRERSNKEYEDFALQTLQELGLDFDRGPFRQSERTEFYLDAIETLLRDDMAYEAEESKDGSGDKVIRFRNPNKKIKFHDTVRGDIEIDATSFGDFVIARSKTNPLYHLTVVVDDIDMGVTDVIRGEDHITSTPRQILLIEALGGIIPKYTHLPMIVGDDKKKLSKRHGAVTWAKFKGLGYLPEAMINYLVLLGWNPGDGDEREIFSKEDLIKEFSLEQINNSPATFSYEKLDDINRHWARKLSTEKYLENVSSFLSEELKEKFQEDKQKAEKIVDFVLKEKVSKFSEIQEMEKQGDLEYFFEHPNVLDDEMISFKDDGIGKTNDLLKGTIKILEDISEENWKPEFLKSSVLDYAKENGVGSVLHPWRTILSGKKSSPDPFVISAILGKEETLHRLFDYLS